MNPITGLLAALGALTAVFLASWNRMIGASKERATLPNIGQIGVGAFTNFLDTLGIGSYATTTTLFRFFRMVDDRAIPGTLNVGHTLPTVVQTFRSEEHTSELQSRQYLVCRLLLEKKKTELV